MIKTYRVRSGAKEMKLQAHCHEDAAIMMLQRVLLEGCGQFIAIKDETHDERDEQWALTEWYLEPAGYVSIGNGRWKKKPSPDAQNVSPSTSGSRQKKESSAPTPPSSRKTQKPKSISSTDSAERTQQHGEQVSAVSETENEAMSEEAMEAARSKVKRVTLNRSDEEWQKIVDAARRNSRNHTPTQ